MAGSSIRSIPRYLNWYRRRPDWGRNDVGLDQGPPGATRVVNLPRVGNRVLTIAQLPVHRAVSRDQAEGQLNRSLPSR